MPPLSLLVFAVGTGSLGAEIAAVRLLAPYFGASTVVWANTIGVVLVALSLGYWLGGRLADRHPHMRGLCLLALTAAGLLAIVPFAAGPLLHVAVDALDSISAGAFAGSLLGVLGLVAVPVLLLGAVSPYALRLAVTTVEEAGTVAGRLYALSTAGSLAGTLGSALLFIPLVGTRRTFLIFALAISVVAVSGLRPLRRWALAPAAIAALIAAAGGRAEGRGRRWPGDLRDRDGVPVRARGGAPERGSRAGAERGAGPALALPPGHGAHRRLLGRVPRAAVRGARPAAPPHGDPGERRRHDRAGLRPALSRHPDRRRGDRLRAVGDRAPLLRHDEPAPAAAPRGRPPVPAPDRRALRRDRARHLPPALHPLLPEHRGVLRAGARPADAPAVSCS